MKWTFFILNVAFALVMTACASDQVVVKVPPPNLDKAVLPQAEYVTSPKRNVASTIDYMNLARDLGLDRAVDVLGYEEKSFDTCRAGYGYSSTQNCHREYFVIIHFQLLCRDSVGTISTTLTRQDMFPLSGRSVAWTLPEIQGNMRLDSEGFGQIRIVARVSPKSQRLKLSTGNEFLYTRAGEITRVVTPREWCN